MLNVLYIAPIALNESHGAGGVETAVENVLQAFSNHKEIKITVLSFRKEKFQSFSNQYSKNITIYQQSAKFKNQFLDIIFYQKRIIKDIINEKRMDVIHFHGTGPSLLSLLGIPKDNIVVTQHGINKIERIYQTSMIKRIKFYYKSIIEDVYFKRFKNFIFISKSNYLLSKQLYRSDFSNHIVIPNIVNNRFFNIMPKAHTSNNVLFVGFISQLKNILLLIKVIKRLRDNNKIFSLRIVGTIKDRDYYQSCKEYINRNNLSDQIKFEGFLNQDELVKLYDEIDIFTLPSKQENSPISLLEALAAGKVAIASDVGGISEIITDKLTGFLFESGNFKELYDALDQLYNNNSLINEISNNSRDFVTTERNPDIITRSLYNFYNTIQNA